MTTLIRTVKVSRMTTLRLVRAADGKYYIENIVNGHHVNTHDYGTGNEGEMIDAVYAKANRLLKAMRDRR
jgi:hypothetical protein